jgi:hypothetical protein
VTADSFVTEILAGRIAVCCSVTCTYVQFLIVCVDIKSSYRIARVLNYGNRLTWSMILDTAVLAEPTANAT